MAYMIYNQLGLKIRGADGEFHDFQGVMQIDKNVVNLTFEDDTTMTVSCGHKFYIKDKETFAEDLKSGDKLDTLAGTKTVKSIEVTNTARPVYSPVEVAPDHKYATANGIINGNCAFIGSTSTLIDPNYLDKMIPADPVEYKYGYSFKIWQKPIEGALYLMGVDSASGTGKDYAVVQVLRLYGKDNFEQVAVYADNTIDAEHFASVVADISEYYNHAGIIIENNEIGKTVADKAWYELECDAIMNTDHNGKIGTRATKTSKLDACIELKRLIENDILHLHDSETIKQLSRFEEVKPYVFKAASNIHDDLVSGLYWACYGTMQPQIDFDSLTVAKKEEDDMPPQTVFFESDEEVWGSILL